VEDNEKVGVELSRGQEQTFSPLDKSEWSQIGKNGYEVNQYESIIKEMKHVMRD
jgi:hypothetical protein